MIRFVACFVLAWALVATASAQDEAVALIVAEDTSEEERDAIATALREELGLEVRSATTASADELALRVSIRGRRARLEVTRPARQRMVRTVRLSRDPETRVHTLVTLAVNLTRDEAAELLSSLQRPPTPEAEVEAAEPLATTVEPTEEQAAVGDAATPEPATQPATEAPPAAGAQLAARVETARPQRATTEPPRTQAQPAQGDASAEVEAEPALDPWRHRILRLGLGAQLGTAPAAGGGVVPWTIYGIDVLVAPLPELAIGVRDLGVISDGQAPVYIAGPVVEGALRLHELLALHAILGCDLQLAFDAFGKEAFSVAPRLGLGARLYPDPIFSIALDVTGRVVATDVFHTATATMPSGAVLLSVGLSFAFHIG